MTDTTLTANPTDIRTALGFAAKLDAETVLAKSATLRNYAISSGILLGVAGLTAAACLLAYGQRNPSADELARALEKMPPITVTVGGEVGISPGASVVLADGGVVALAPDATVQLDASSLSSLKLPDLSSQPARQGDEAIKRSVTIFSFIEDEGVSVSTGWVFPNGAAKAPTSEFCYQSRPLGDGRAERIDLGLDGKPHSDGQRLLAGRFKDRFAKCIWWDKGASL